MKKKSSYILIIGIIAFLVVWTLREIHITNKSRLEKTRVIDAVEILETMPSNESETVGELYSLELIFGNGEVLKKEITLLAVPTYQGVPYSYYRHYTYIALQEYELEHPEEMDGMFGLEKTEKAVLKASALPSSSVIFEDGTLYSLGEAYKAEVDRNGRTLKVWLWRDEPYEQERNYFNNSTANIKE